jgi:hypothetical protein
VLLALQPARVKGEVRVVVVMVVMDLAFTGRSV